MAIVTYVSLTVLLCWCRFLSCAIDGGVNKVNAFAFYITPCNKQSLSCRAVTLRAQCNALTYRSIDLEQYAPNHRIEHSNQQNISSISRVFKPSFATQHKYGVTSLHVMSLSSINQTLNRDPMIYVTDVDTSHDTIHVLVGTKYGELVVLPIELRNMTWLVSRHIRVEWPSLSHTKKETSSVPNYCIASIQGTTVTTCLVGSADRYVHVWQKDVTDGQWNMTQRLGPHTGWVKSLVTLPPVSHSIDHHNDSVPPTVDIDHFQHRFLSIGCNRMEHWIGSICQTNSHREDTTWTHLGTLSVSSSPLVSAVPASNPGPVCTLSSDLLCLEVCTILTPGETHTIIAVGGVDGRIHFYKDSSTATDCLDHIATVIAHQGRVNVLSFDATRQLLMSGSHDGSLHCWSFAWKVIQTCHQETLVVERIVTYRFPDGERVTALLCFTSQRSNSSIVDVIAGTQNGSIFLLAMECCVDLKEDYDILVKSKIRLGEGTHELNANGPMITTLCRLCTKNISRSLPNAFVVGHSQGMGIMQLHDEAGCHP